MYWDALKELELMPRHFCCEECENLFPPYKAGIIDLGSVKYKTQDKAVWYLEIGADETVEMDVKFCPWCGVFLELPKDKMSNV